MNYKTIFTIIIITTVVATLCIMAMKPKMHKVMLIYNSDYELVNNETPKTEDRDIPVVVQEEQTKTSKMKLNEIADREIASLPKQTTTVKKQTAPVKQNTVAVKKETKKQPEVKKQTAPVKQNTVAVKKEIKQPVPEKKVTVKQEPKTEPKKVEVKQAPVVNAQKTVQKPAEPVKVKTTQTLPAPQVLTKEQEEIAWNVWRSNLQNKIMQDTNLPTVPNGTVFRFKFDVDKYGRVSNIQTYSDTPQYTPYAIQYIAPVIRSYQGKRILNFPQGTSRITTTAKGAWKISNNLRYSTPKDYNDTEIIQR